MKGMPSREMDGPVTYQVKVKGLLDERWSDWFDSFTITPLESGETLLTGPVTDQAALHGLLNKIRDIGLPLLSVNRVEVEK
jgi:hypothetical protein